MDWEGIGSIVDETNERRGLGGMDTFLTVARCERGHQKRGIGAIVGAALTTPEVAREKLAQVTATPGPCPDCGAAAPVVEAAVAMRLPLAREHVLVAHDGTVALRPFGGPATLAAPGDPRLRELAPAETTRAFVGNVAFSGAASSPEDARRALRPALEAWPEYAPALCELGKVDKRAGDLASAVDAFERAVRAAPELADAHFLLADVLDEVGEDERAIVHYRRVSSLDPVDTMAYSQMGIVLKRLGRTEEAWSAYQRALAIDPHHTPTLMNVVAWWSQRGDLAQALEAVGAAAPSTLQHNEVYVRNSFDVAAMRGLELAEKGEWVGAARAFELASFVRPDAKTYFNWAVALANLGAARDALAKARQALALDPGYEKARGLAAELEREEPAAGLVAIHAPHHLRYVDSLGVAATMLGFVVKSETPQAFMDIAVKRLSLAEDKDLVKLLVAKGHNARVEGVAGAAGAPKKSLFDDALAGLSGASAPARPAPEEGRPFVFIAEQEPEPDFLALAGARTWVTAAGREIPSAPVQILRGVDEDTYPAPDGTFHLTRTVEWERRQRPERYFIPQFSEYEGDDVG